MKQLDLISKPPKPPRKKPRVLMRVYDAGEPGVQMQCPKCGHKTDWLGYRGKCPHEGEMYCHGDGKYTFTEICKGLPCPVCNKKG